MSFSLALGTDVVFVLVTIGIYAFAVYKAIASRRVLVAPAYRSWAIWTGAYALLAIPYEANLVRLDLGIGLSGPWSSLLIPAISFAGAAVGFVWVERTIGVGLGLDFFHRDILGWERGGRVVAGIAFLVSAIAFWVFNLFQGQIVLFVVFVYLVGTLLISTRRAHEDVMLDYIRWVALSFVSTIFATSVGIFTGYNFLQVLGAYFLYRSAGSLSGSTFHMEFSSLFDAPRDFVYMVYTNPDMMTKITKSYRTAKLQGKDADGRDVVEITAEVLGIKLSGIVKRKYIPPDGMEEEAIADTGVGATRFSFTPENDGTRVRFSLDFEPKGALTKFLGGLGASRVRRQFEQDGATGKAYCEANKPR